MGATWLLAVLGLIAAAYPQIAAAEETTSARTIIQGLPTPPVAVEEPPLCSEREHLGEEGFLVDQAWQAYRRLERSSPLRVGWCGCAKQCERIDKQAAEYEKIAFQAKAASVDPGIPPEQREEYGELSIEMFGERNETVEEFRACLDATRPPLSPPMSVALRGSKIPGGCTKVRTAWDDWCDKINDQMKPIYSEFYLQFQVKKTGRYSIAVPLRASPDGTIKIHGQTGWNGLTSKQIKEYRDKIAAVKAGPFPKGSKLPEVRWISSLEVNKDGDDDHGWRTPMACPDEELPAQ
jgi:hypothetical protein